MKVDQITAILDTGGGKVTDLADAEIMSKTIEAIIGRPPQGEEKSLIGQETLDKATTVLGELVISMTKLTDILDPNQVKPTITSVTNTIGTLFDALYGMSDSFEKSLSDDFEEILENEIDDENNYNR